MLSPVRFRPRSHDPMCPAAARGEDPSPALCPVLCPGPTQPGALLVPRLGSPFWACLSGRRRGRRVEAAARAAACRPPRAPPKSLAEGRRRLPRAVHKALQGCGSLHNWLAVGPWHCCAGLTVPRPPPGQVCLPAGLERRLVLFELPARGKQRKR
jgi:hypothetical protein